MSCFILKPPKHDASNEIALVFQKIKVLLVRYIGLSDTFHKKAFYIFIYAVDGR